MSAESVSVSAGDQSKIIARCEAVTLKCSDFGSRLATIKASALSGAVDPLDFEQQISELESSDTELHQIRASRVKKGVFNPSSGVPDGGDAQLMTAALCLSAGLPNPDKHFDERTLDYAGKMSRGIGLQQVLMRCACANGYSNPHGERVTQGNLREVLQFAFRSDVKMSSGWSTLSISTVLSNTANKFLREGFDSVDQTCLRIAAIKPVTNFKTQTTVSLVGGTTFSEVGSGGELKHGTLDEVTYSNKADTYGVMLGITRTQIINDDLDALSAAPRKIGRGGMLKLNNLVWTKFLDNSSFFTSGNGSLSSGGTTNLAADGVGLGLAEKKFMAQTDPDSNPLGIMPAILLVPPSLKRIAMGLMNSQFYITGANVTATSGNVWQGAYQVESSPYMENSAFTGYSTAAWYLLASPAQLPVLEIAALNGNVQSTVETSDADFNVLGIQMRGYSDAGAALMEYRGGVKSAGS